MGKLEGRVALVTGAARGIGRGIALCLAEEGASLILSDLPPRTAPPGADLGEVASAVRALGANALVQVADVTDRRQVEELVAAGVERFGQIDIAVANAGASVRQPVLTAEWAGVLRTVDVVEFGVFHTCQLVARHMSKRAVGGADGGSEDSNGKIVIIGSILAEVPRPSSAAYNMAKAAVVQFGRTLAAELAPYRINVNVVNPGWIDTPGERHHFDEGQLAKAAKSLPWGRLGTPRDIGQVVAFLASADANYITGTSLLVDGGYQIGMTLEMPDE